MNTTCSRCGRHVKKCGQVRKPRNSGTGRGSGRTYGPKFCRDCRAAMGVMG